MGICRNSISSSLTLLALVASCGVTWAAGRGVQPNTDVGIDPYYTGSLLTPSPAVPRAGLLAFEPYVIATRSPQTYGTGGGLRGSTDTTSSLATFTIIKYGITDNLTAAVFPQSMINHDAMGFDSGSRVGDLPLELEYLLARQDKVTGKPSITLYAGLVAPTGRYDMLPNASDGQGNGTYRARAQILLQSLQFALSEHPVRLRAYANAITPLSTTDVHGVSTFGTAAGFAGTGRAGTVFGIGGSVEYSVTQKFVLALDAFYTASTSSHAYGRAFDGAAASLRSGHSDTLQIAPQIEYSLGPRFGIVAGVNLSVEGHNTGQIIQPQIAFNYVFDTAKGLETFVNPYTGP